MFDKLGKFEASKWYVVIAVWIVVVILAAPFTSLFFNSVSNQITISIPGSTAQQAQEITSKYFHIGGASSASALLFIQGNTSAYSTFFANFTKYGNASISDFFTIEKGILNSSFYKGINGTRSLEFALQNISNSEVKIEGKLNSAYTNLTNGLESLEKLNESIPVIEGKFVNLSSVIYNTSDKVEQIHQEGEKLNTSFTYLKGNETLINSTATKLNLLEFGTVAEFLEVWGKAFNQTHDLTVSNGIAFKEIYYKLNGTASVYFRNFDLLWNSSYKGGNPEYVASGLIPKATNETFYGTKEYGLSYSLATEFSLQNFQNSTLIQQFTANYVNQTFHVPLEIAQALLFESPLNVTIHVIQEKSGLPSSVVEEALTDDNFTGIATQIIEEKANSSAIPFINEVYKDLNSSPSQFAVNYLSKVANVSPSLIERVMTSNSTQLIQYLASQASNKNGIPSWVYVSLIENDNVQNLTSYLVSTHLTKLSGILEKSNITPKGLAEELAQGVNAEELASQLVANSFLNSSPTISVNTTILQDYLFQGVKDNISPEKLALMSISSGKFPVQPIERLRDQLYNGSYLLVIIGGNVTYKETQQIQQYVESHMPSFTGKVYLTGGKPVSHVIGGIGSSAFAIAIPVGIALAIILTGVYFRSIVAAFVPLTVYMAAYVAASDLIYAVVIKILGITVDFLTPSQVLLLALGLGTDYVVFMASRYIEEREKGLDKKESVIEMVKWGGKAVTITAFVVALSFLFIYVYNVPFFSDTAIAEMLAVLVIWVASITLFPSVLAAVGDKLFFPRKIVEKKEKEVKGKYSKAGVKAGIVIGLVAISAVLAIGTPLTFNILGLLPPSKQLKG
ncbi:MMPL family transporter [Sulfuracidifex tepidarius]|uniref:MMPL family transporter n=1 Tax=Sulfuracidifex tepidarius TaxID=1294262 RepID=UPI000A4018C4|nr:MMPL family transporter [Sulfuracidifex tepidarius]